MGSGRSTRGTRVTELVMGPPESYPALLSAPAAATQAPRLQALSSQRATVLLLLSFTTTHQAASYRTVCNTSPALASAILPMSHSLSCSLGPLWATPWGYTEHCAYTTGIASLANAACLRVFARLAWIQGAQELVTGSGKS